MAKQVTAADELHDLLASVEDQLSNPSTTKFNPLRDWFVARLGIRPDDVGVVFCSKPGNFSVRFNQTFKNYRKLFVAVLKEEDLEGTTKAAEGFVADSGKVGAVALCAKHAGRWKIRAVVERPKGPLASPLKVIEPSAKVVEVGEAMPSTAGVPQLASDVLVDEAWIEDALWMLEDRTHAIALFGPPGTGKTFIAQRLAKFLQPNDSLRTVVQLHPSYGYEEFFEGYRPTSAEGPQDLGGAQLAKEASSTYNAKATSGIQLAKQWGPLRKFSKLAADNPDQKVVIVLDEMNRGNLPKIFGELYFLLEYRDESVELMYSPGERFNLPKNLYLIGTLNTADRSVALLDQALRRRFHFIGLFPGERPVNGMLRRYLEARASHMGWVADVLDEANRRLADRHLAIGPSHFMRRDLDETVLRRIWEHSVLPTIEEQIFQSHHSLEDFHLDKLRRAVDEKALPAPATKSDQDD